MARDGCRDALRVGGGGDLGADVKATDPFGRGWVIQCKHRRNGDRGSAVGTPDLQVLNGTARRCTARTGIHAGRGCCPGSVGAVSEATRDRWSRRGRSGWRCRTPRPRPARRWRSTGSSRSTG
ncbi:restriction endonuclease [Streptomyces sp. Ru72]|uniref:restriction endonuclease n=1 Tax=Streptomyces sp. Ru72 TaxID=2080747 RepID=UPI0027E3CEC5|nr:restriction endonuclease [Streptomyces sp. Ru72]